MIRCIAGDNQPAIAERVEALENKHHDVSVIRVNP